MVEEAGDARSFSTEAVRASVKEAYERQRYRYRGTKVRFNSELSVSQISEYCALGEKEEELLENAFEMLGLSARSCHRVIKTARTIADLEGAEKIGCAHLSEAIIYKSLDGRYWHG